MSEDIEKVPVENLEVKSQPTDIKSVVGSEEFVKEFVKLLQHGDPWRTPKGLSRRLNVDQVDLQRWMDKHPEICRRPGKEDGIFYYAIASRIERPKEVKGMERRAIMEEDRYMFALLHQSYGIFLRLMEKYALHIHDKNSEAFAALAQARDRMSAGVVLLSNSLNADTNKLPKL